VLRSELLKRLKAKQDGNVKIVEKAQLKRYSAFRPLEVAPPRALADLGTEGNGSHQ
jgi:hypothetical protein